MRQVHSKTRRRLGEEDESMGTATLGNGFSLLSTRRERKNHSSYVFWKIVFLLTGVIMFVVVRHERQDMTTNILSYDYSFLFSFPATDDANEVVATRINENDCPPSKKVKKSVFVIGAGASGLTAARRLVRQQYDPSSCYELEVKILEASSAFGGRVKKDNTGFTDYPLDLGASWVYDPSRLGLIAQNPSILKKLSNKMTSPASIEGFKGYKIRQDGKRRRTHLDEERNLLWVNYSWFDFFDEQVVSALDNNQFVFDCPVDRIEYLENHHKALVACGRNKFMADHVILTAPLSVLQSDDIDIRPYPKFISQHPGKMWKGFKIFFEFAHKFYDDYFEYKLEDGELEWWDYSLVQINSTKNILAGYYMGEANIPFLGLTEDQIVKGVLKDLDQLFGNKTATKAYVRHLLVNWSKDPYIRGTYSSDSSEELAGPQVAWTDTRLVIAGEAYPVPTGHNGWVDGAALSGLHAAELVLHQISPDMMAKEGFSIRSGWLSGSDD